MKFPWMKKSKKYSEFKIPTQDELYEQQFKQIIIEPKYWDVTDSVLSFIEQLCFGYLWEIKHGNNFIAVHAEQRGVEDILHRIAFVKRLNNEKKEAQDAIETKWLPNYDEEIQLILVDFARIVPKMWD